MTRMTSVRLILLRLYMITLGRLSLFSGLMRAVLPQISGRGGGGHAGSSAEAGYFDLRDLEPHSLSVERRF